MLKKLIIPLLFISTVCFSAPSNAENLKAAYDPVFALLDVIALRPMGLAGTILGTAGFVVISPLTALASIAPPHDAFEKMGYILVKTPYDFTFVRPVGVNLWDKFQSPPMTSSK